MLNNGCTEEELFTFFSWKKQEDLDHNYIMSSMCTLPNTVAVRAHCMFMETNLDDPDLFPGTASLEQLFIKWFGALCHCPDVGGYAPSGGTESNLQTLRLAKARQKEIVYPNAIIPESAHLSFKKSCDILDIKMRGLPLTGELRMDVDAAAEQIDSNTIVLVGIAGTSEYGMVDPIATLAKIASRHNVFFHVDAAFGGMVIPFLDKPIPFDFSLPGVTTIAVDPHKMGMSTILAGCLLTREPDMLNYLNLDTQYLTVKQEFALAGTNPGAQVVGALAVMDYLGKVGMLVIVKWCMKNTHHLIAGIETFGFTRAATPNMNVATFIAKKEDISEPWKVSWTRHGHLRIVCMQHVHSEHIEAFLADIGESYA